MSTSKVKIKRTNSKYKTIHRAGRRESMKHCKPVHHLSPSIHPSLMSNESDHEVNLPERVIELDSFDSKCSSSSCESFASPLSPSNNKESNKNKVLRFDTTLTEYHENDRNMESEQEWISCWYTPEELLSFRQDQAAMMKRQFAHDHHQHNKEEISHQHHKDSEKESSALSKAGRPSKRQLSLENSSISGNIPKNLHQQQQNQKQQQLQSQHPKDHKSASIEPAATPSWRQIVAQAYEECRKVKHGESETLTGKVDQDGLKLMYRYHPDLVGLEIYVLYRLRGPVHRQVQQMLCYIQESPCNEQDVARACRNLTQPASVFVHKIAVALADALKEEESGRNSMSGGIE